ncbi:serine hydrolase domain-containing protein [Rhodococcus sp. UNC363MFTsu5.1]|uniref:serine hydrolase domain-containing protein n=1 Tax=Rhodococcus sp. UNC363MFTsu5.1 TaxID=1449069 RepID=UPI0012DC121E|nr:serine hydrolase domain-containing protein [Rhodococcus sp. UNC363MFTsu5.1]
MTRRRVLVLSTVLVLALVAGIAVWWLVRDTDELRQPDNPSAAIARLERELPGVLAEARVPAAAVALVVDGRPSYVRGFGEQNGRPVDEGTIFQAGSISKTVAAAALVRRFAGQLDMPVLDRLQGWALPPGGPDPAAITLRTLLSHTAGINVPGYLGTAQPAAATVDSLLGRAGSEPVRQSEKPGRYRYSGGGYTIAQLYAESVTGAPLPEVIEDEVLAPLGMNRSGYACGPEVIAGHDQDGRPMPRYRYAESAAAGLCTSVDDLGRFAAWLSSEDPVAVQLRQPVAGTDGAYGLGIELDGPEMVGHLGVNRGYYARLLINPSQRFGVAVVTNGDHGDRVVARVLKIIAES